MRQNHCHIALGYAESHEKHKEGNTRDDVRIEHRDVVQEGHHLALAAPEVVYAYRRDCTQNRGQECGNQTYGKGVFYGADEGIVQAAAEDVAVEIEREAGPVAKHLCLCE